MKSSVKKVLIVLGGFFVLFLAAIVVIPMVVDVDQYRPKIVAKANERLNGKLELGRLELSLWGTIRVKIEGLDLNGAKGEKIVAVKDAFVTLPWTSIFSGAPVLTFNMRDPEVRVLKDAQGKINVMDLMKEESASAAADAPVEAGDGSADLPSFVTNARLGMDIRNALFTYSDEVAKSETTMRDLNLKVQDLSLSRPSEIELSGLFSSQAEDLFKVSGPFVISMRANPSVENGEFQGVSGDLKGDFSGIEIRAADLFHKRKGDAATVSGALTLGKDVLSISKLEAKFFNAELSAEGRVMDLQGEPKVDFNLKSNPIALQPWSALVPMLKEYSLSGTADLSARANGSASKLQYTASLDVKDLKAKSPMLKVEPVMNVAVRVVTDKIEVFTATMKAPRNDLTIQGSLVSFEKPRIDLRVRSSGMDLDHLLNLPEEPAKGASAGGASAGNSASNEDYDAMLEPLRTNEIARSTVAAASVDLKNVKFMDVSLLNIEGKLSLRNLVLSIDSATAKLWDGTIGVKGSTAMAMKVPTYRFDASISGLDLQKAVTSKMEKVKNTVLGRVEMKVSGNGSSYNPEKAMATLAAKGSFKITNAAFQSIDISKMVTEAVNKALEKVGDKLPAAKGKSIKPLPEGASKYEFIASDFSIGSGRFSMPNFNAKAAPRSGLDIRGSTEIGLLDEELKAEWEIIDTYDMTKASQVGFEVAGVRVDNALAERGKPLVLPVTIGCKYTAPCPSYGKVPEHFLKVAANNAKKGATQAVKEKAKEEVKDKAKDAGKKLLKGIFR